MYILLNRKGTNKSRSTEIKNIAVDPEVHHIGKHGFQFGYILTDVLTRTIPIDKTYFDIVIEQSNTFGVYGQNGTSNVTQIPSKLCGEDFAVAKDYIKLYGQTSGLQCAQTANSTISGNYLSNNYRTIVITVFVYFI